MTYQPDRFATVKDAPAWMTMAERVLLYALIVGLRPARILEIGTFQGGSTLIMCSALDDLGHGSIVCVDPEPRVSPEHLDALSHRTTILAGASPDVLGRAMAVAGAPFDFALIDGDHSFAGLVRDIERTLPTLASSAHLLFHDAHYHEVEKAIDECLAHHPGQLIDAGLLSVEATPHGEPVEGVGDIFWGGLRLLLFRRSGL